RCSVLLDLALQLPRVGAAYSCGRKSQLGRIDFPDRLAHLMSIHERVARHNHIPRPDVATSLAYNLCMRETNMSPLNLPPGPRSPAFWQLLHYSHDPLGFFEKCERRYGTPFTVRWTKYGT